ncbi:MAG: hypothetical protein WCO29_03720 [Nostocales cyanobacterium ELA583]
MGIAHHFNHYFSFRKNTRLNEPQRDEGHEGREEEEEGEINTAKIFLDLGSV